MEILKWFVTQNIFSSQRFWLFWLLFLAAVKFPPDLSFRSALRAVLLALSSASKALLRIPFQDQINSQSPPPNLPPPPPSSNKSESNRDVPD